MPKDWKGGSASTFKTIGASNHTEHERGDADYYATSPAATDWLCKIEQFKSPILEPACGEGHISRQLITNPPYAAAQEFVEQALKIIQPGRKVAMLLKLTFLEGKGRWTLFKDNPPRRVWVSRTRLKCAINGDFDSIGSSAIAYAWFIWEKGFQGFPEIRWFN